MQINNEPENQNVQHKEDTTKKMPAGNPHIPGIIFILLGLFYSLTGYLLYIFDPSLYSCVCPNKVTKFFKFFYGTSASYLFFVFLVILAIYILIKRLGQTNKHYYRVLFYYINPLTSLIIGLFVMFLFLASSMAIDCANSCF